MVKRYVAAMIRSAKTDEGLTEENFKELKQDISSFRYEVLDLLGNRKPPRRTYSSSSEATQQDETAEPEEVDEERNHRLGGHTCVDEGERSRYKASTSFSQCYRRNRESQFSISALFKSISGPAREKPESNGLRKNISHPSPFVQTNSRLQHFSHSKKNSLQRLGMLMLRMNGHVPDTHAETLEVQQSAYSISDRVPQTSWHNPQNLSKVTRSETHLHTLGLGALETEENPMHAISNRANGSDNLFHQRPGHSLPPLHCASSLTTSSVQLLASSDYICHSWLGPCDSLGSSSWEPDETVTTQL